MSKKNKKRVDIVYSTNPNFNYNEEDEEIDSISPEIQKLKISIDRKQRKGKSVTLIEGFIGSDTELKDLAKLLKSKCGVGGSTKNQEIIIQGEFKDKIYNLLLNLGYKQTKKIGG